MAQQRGHRNPGDLEIGATDVLAPHPEVHLALEHAPPVSERRLWLESKRPTWLREMIAEAMGVFCYVYCGVAAIAAFNLTTAAKETGFGSLLTVGLAFGFGIAFALITSAKTSGGHFNPCITICFALFVGFPWRKVPQYVFSQCFGAFMAVLIVFAQYHEQIHAFEKALTAAGVPLVSATGPAAIFVAIPQPGQSMGALFANEFFADFFLGLVIWSVLDPTNNFMSPVAAPWAIGLAYSTMVWGFGVGTLSTNLARDFGARCATAIFYGGEVFTTHNHYAALAALVNIPATICAAAFYQLVFHDSTQMIKAGHATHPEVYRTITAEKERRQREGLPLHGVLTSESRATPEKDFHA